MKLTLGFSPCPNDTFIFDAMVNGKIDTGDLEFDVVMEDVEMLNRSAFESRLDITKLSFPALFANLDKYVLLNSGSALGKGVGPLLIAKKNPAVTEIKIENSTIALPGKNTTANMLFSYAFPDAKRKRFMIFSSIENAVLNEETDLGVIIHENRFTYQQKGLHKITDLGEYWEDKMKLPIPLGGIAINRNLSKETGIKIQELIKKSIAYAFSNYPVLPDYVRNHSQEMNEQVMRQHIELYVNSYSSGLGPEGRRAIQALFNVFIAQHSSPFPEISSSHIFLS